jgi:hypothetical protein
VPSPDPAHLQAQIDALQEELSALRAAPPAAATPEEQAVLRTARAEYLAGHRADNAKSYPVTRGEYRQALYEHYQAVRAYIRAQAKETPNV